MNMNCPRCGKPLEKSFYQGRVSFACPDGHGRGVALSVVRALCGHPGFANSLWRRAAENPSVTGGDCPICHQPMTLVSLPLDNGNLELDICCRCQEVWFDPKDLEALPEPPPPPKEYELPQKAKEILAMHTIEQMNAESDQEPPSGWWCLAGLFGFPVEVEAPPIARFSWCTWIIALVCFIVFFATVEAPEIISEWGLVPAECLRHEGLTFITSMFLHGGLMHLIGNLYFLLIFADNVEDALGRPMFMLLLLVSGIGGSLLHVAIFPQSNVPMVGASGFISGIIAAYAVFFPQVSIRLLLGLGPMLRWIRIPAWGAFGLWMAYQTILAFISFHHQTEIAFFVHVGGAIIGLVIGFMMRQQIHERIVQSDTPNP